MEKKLFVFDLGNFNMKLSDTLCVRNDYIEFASEDDTYQNYDIEVGNKRYKFGLRQQECQARHFATILTEYAAEKNKPVEKVMENDKILDELNLIIMELYAREVSNNCVVRELQSVSWIALCDKGIELFKQLKV